MEETKVKKLEKRYTPFSYRRTALVVRQPSFDWSWRSFTPLAALLLLDVVPATPASERLASDAKSSPDTLVKGGLTDH